MVVSYTSLPKLIILKLVLLVEKSLRKTKICSIPKSRHATNKFSKFNVQNAN